MPFPLSLVVPNVYQHVYLSMFQNFMESPVSLHAFFFLPSLTQFSLFNNIPPTFPGLFLQPNYEITFKDIILYLLDTVMWAYLYSL